MNSLLHYNFNDFIYVIRNNGVKSKRYKHWCLKCSKDRGYAYKNKIVKETLCHSCKMKDPKVLATISKNSKKLVHSLQSKLRIQRSLFKKYNSSPIKRKIARNLRARLNKAIKGNWKSGSAVSDLGCSISLLKQHLESKFQPGMTWDNYGKWHIDHIEPLCKFDLTNGVELKKACHYSNLQPLWWHDNLNKRHTDGTF